MQFTTIECGCSSTHEIVWREASTPTRRVKYTCPNDGEEHHSPENLPLAWSTRRAHAIALVEARSLFELEGDPVVVSAPTFGARNTTDTGRGTSSADVSDIDPRTAPIDVQNATTADRKLEKILIDEVQAEQADQQDPACGSRTPKGSEG